MNKSIILYLVLLFPVARLIAQEPVFRNFDVQKGKGQYFIVQPKNYESLLKSKQIDTLFDIGLRYFDDKDYEDIRADEVLYRNLKEEMSHKTVPERVREKVQQIMNKDTSFIIVRKVDHCLYVNVLTDRMGNILNVFFETSAKVLAILTEEEVQQTFDAFMGTKINAEIMSLTDIEKYYNREQTLKMWEYLVTHQVELRKKAQYSPLKVFDILGIKPVKLNYALLEFQVGDPGEAYKYRTNLKKHNGDVKTNQVE